MNQDQDTNQDQDLNDTKSTETNQDQANQQDQETITPDSLEKAKADIAAKFKEEIAGLNRQASKLDRQLKEKERESLSETERKAAELKDLEADKLKAEAELNDIRKKRIIDKALYDNELPVDLFENRIMGETPEEIAADVMAMKDHIKGIIDKEVQRQVKELLKGKDPGRQDSEVNVKKMKRNEFDNLDAKARSAFVKDGGVII